MSQVREDSRAAMMAALVAEIGAGATTYIYFMNIENDVLCEVKFNELVHESGDGDLATYTFRNSTMTPPNVLYGGVTASGLVSQFRILENGYTDPIEDERVVVSGTVGVIGSLADIEFNTVNWNQEDAISISQLTIQLPNG